MNRNYKFLTQRGFKCKKNFLLGKYCWQKNNICIGYYHDVFNQKYEYRISLSYDTETPVFRNLVCWELGAELERNRLSEVIAEYSKATSLQLQMDNLAKIVEVEHRNYLEKHLDDIIHGGVLHKMLGAESTEMPLYYVAERFFPSQEYVDFSLLTARSEIVTYDIGLCCEITQQNYDIPQVTLKNDEQIIAVFKNPTKTTKRKLGKEFEFCGYDLSEEQTMISAITNCGALFDHTIDIEDLNKYGLYSSLKKASSMKEFLKEKYPEEPHAHCEIYEVWRKT